MQRHVITNQQHVVENQHEHFHILAALNEKLESVLEKLEHGVENGSNFEQIPQMSTAGCDDSQVLQPPTTCSDDSQVLQPPPTQIQARPSLDGEPELRLAPRHHHPNKVSVQLQCDLETRRMQGHDITDQQCIVENKHEESRAPAALNDELESVFEKLDHIEENSGDLEQIVQNSSDDLTVLSPYSPSAVQSTLPNHS